MRMPVSRVEFIESGGVLSWGLRLRSGRATLGHDWMNGVSCEAKGSVLGVF